MRGLIKTMHVRSAVPSLQSVDVPQFEVPSSQGDRYVKTRDNTWEKDRYQLDICMRFAGGQWRDYVSVSIQNHKSVPYSSQPLLEYLSDGLAYGIADGVELGAKFTDAGFGLPALSDQITIFGEVHEEEVYERGVIRACTPVSFSVSPSSSLIISEDPQRQQALLINSGDIDVWVARGDTAQVGAGLLILPGGTLTIERYTGPVSAVSAGAGALVGEVCL